MLAPVARCAASSDVTLLQMVEKVGSLPSGGAGSARASTVCGGDSASVMSTGACSLLLDRGVVVSSWFTCCVSCDMSR